jgi:hypothetical protein
LQFTGDINIPETKKPLKNLRLCSDLNDVNKGYKRKTSTFCVEVG